MIDRIERQGCTGCSACFNICPQKAITMKADEKGFFYPALNKERCVECGLCIKICPAVNETDTTVNYPSPKIYAAWSLDEDIRINSTSGGIFSELAKAVLRHGGCVAGAQYDKNHLVNHILIDNEDDLIKLRQSKYIQSDVNHIYLEVKKQLKCEKKVLFVGSPCEIAGLRHFLGKEYANLILCDFVCRGTNSPRAYTEYIKDLENRFQSKVKRVWFKNKTKGWNLFSTKIIFENGKEYIEDRNHDAFMLGYIHYNLFMRDCCGSCKYKELPRISDISLADFWGIGSHRSELDEDKGTSMVMINSDKGSALFNSIQSNIFCSECPLEWAIQGNSCILNVAKKNKYYDAFFKELGSIAFEELIEKYVKQNQKRTVSNILKSGSRAFYKKIKISMRNLFDWCKLWLWKQNEKKQVALLRKTNKNPDFTLITNNCMAGFIYHNLGVKFLSPTINLYIKGKEYLEFCKNFKYYSTCELVEDTGAKERFPVGIIMPHIEETQYMPIHVYFQHFKTFEEASKKWKERCKRINFNNLFFVWEFYDSRYDIALIREFDQLPIKNMAVLHRHIDGIKNATVLSCYKDDLPTAKIFQYDGITGKRFLDQFDYVAFLNN